MRKPADIDAQIKALQDKAKSLKERQKMCLGKLVLATGADSLSLEALAGVLLAAVEQGRDKSETVARWTERGTAFFRRDKRPGNRGNRSGVGGSAPGAASIGVPGAAGSYPAS